MILEALKSLYPNASEKVLVAHKIEDDSKPTCVGNESSFVYGEGSDEIDD